MLIHVRSSRPISLHCSLFTSVYIQSQTLIVLALISLWTLSLHNKYRYIEKKQMWIIHWNLHCAACLPQWKQIDNAVRKDEVKHVAIFATCTVDPKVSPKNNWDSCSNHLILQMDAKSNSSILLFRFLRFTIGETMPLSLDWWCIQFQDTV